jgi:two-component system, cell cycle sensor histidine kinase and response regulator CckA
MTRILIVDDEWLTRTEIAEMLAAQGYDVAGQASSGRQAVDMARELMPDLILMDVVLPGEMDGIGAAETIHATLDIPIIFISGYGDEEYIQRAKEIETFGYVIKPFDEREVRAFVEIALHKKQLETRLKQANAELVRVNDRLGKSSREWEGIFQAIGQPAFILDGDHAILKANRSALEATGSREQDLIGKTCYAVFHNSEAPPTGCPFEKMKISGRLETGEMPVEHLNRTFLISCTPMMDPNGRLEKVIHIATDITEQKRMEAQVRQAQKMKAIGTLAAGIAHQFNNALTAITWHNSLIEMKDPDNRDISKHIDGIERSVDRMARLTSQLLAYARGGKYAVKDLSLGGLIQETLPLLKQGMNPQIRLTAQLPPNVRAIRADQDQLKMVLSALTANACEAMDEDGSGAIRISVENIDLDEAFLHDHPGLTAGPYVLLSVQDNGKGMDEETRQRIFAPFFTTHLFGRGLGMAAVYGIVKNHDGWIDVDSEPGKGTTVKIYFPSAPG